MVQKRLQMREIRWTNPKAGLSSGCQRLEANSSHLSLLGKTRCLKIEGDGHTDLIKHRTSEAGNHDGGLTIDMEGIKYSAADPKPPQREKGCMPSIFPQQPTSYEVRLTGKIVIGDRAGQPTKDRQIAFSHCSVLCDSVYSIPQFNDILLIRFWKEKLVRQSRDKPNNGAHDALDPGRPKYHKRRKLSLSNALLSARGIRAI